MTFTKNPTPNEKPSPKTSRRKRSPSPSYSALEKVQAVLAVWTDRCKPVEACRQMRVNWVTFQQWQDRALEGMLQALERRVNLNQGAALSPRLQLLLRKQQRALSTDKLDLRLAHLQPPPSKVANAPAPQA